MDPTITGLVKAGVAARRGFRAWRVRRRAKKRAKQIARGEIPDDRTYVDPLTEEIDEMFPKGAMTKSGIITMVLGGVLGIALPAMGVGECTPEQVVEGCVGAGAITNMIVEGVGALVGGIGAIIAWRGKNRADRGYPPA